LMELSLLPLARILGFIRLKLETALECPCKVLMQAEESRLTIK
jgi:hypothetical protein